MISPKIFTIFGVTWAAWLMVIGETIIMVLVNLMVYWLYKRLSLYKQFSPKINRIALISGLACISLIGVLTWLFSVGLLLSQ